MIDRRECQRFHENLNQYFDDALSVEDRRRMDEHLGQCESCAAFKRNEHFGRRYLSSMRSSEVSRDETDAVVEKVMRTALKKIRKRASSLVPERELLEDRPRHVPPPTVRATLDSDPDTSSGSASHFNTKYSSKWRLLAAAACIMLLFVIADVIAEPLIAWVKTLWGTVDEFKSKPASLAMTSDGRGVTLSNHKGEVILSWESREDNGFLSAFDVESIEGSTHERLGIIATQSDTKPQLPLGLVAFHFYSPHSILWSRQVLQEHIPTNLPRRRDYEWLAEQLGIKKAKAFDVFPQVPGMEIVAIFQHETTLSTIHVYDTKGTLLWQFWHDGNIADVHYLSEPDLLVCQAVNGAVDVLRRGVKEASYFHPNVLFAVRPDLGNTKPTWVNTVDHVGGIEPAWYRALQSLPTTNAVRSIHLDYPNPGHDRSVVFDVLISLQTPVSDARFSMVMNGNGLEASHPRSLNDPYRRALSEYRSTPRDTELWWGNLPPIVNYEGVWLPGPRRTNENPAAWILDESRSDASVIEGATDDMRNVGFIDNSHYEHQHGHIDENGRINLCFTDDESAREGLWIPGNSDEDDSEEP